MAINIKATDVATLIAKVVMKLDPKAEHAIAPSFAHETGVNVIGVANPTITAIFMCKVAVVVESIPKCRIIWIGWYMLPKVKASTGPCKIE